MKDYSDILKDVESGKYIKEVPPDGTPAHEIGHSLKQISVSVQYLEELRRIADAAETRAKLAEQKAENAEKDAKFSKWLSIISIAVTLIVGIAQAVPQLL